MDWFDLLAVQGTLKSLLQHHSSKASIFWHSAFFTVQLSHLYMTTGKTIALTRQIFVGKIMSLLLNMLSTLVITFLPRSKRLLISWLHLPSVVILVTYLTSKKHVNFGDRGVCPSAQHWSLIDGFICSKCLDQPNDELLKCFHNLVKSSCPEPPTQLLFIFPCVFLLFPQRMWKSCENVFSLKRNS